VPFSPESKASLGKIAWSMRRHVGEQTMEAPTRYLVDLYEAAATRQRRQGLENIRRDNSKSTNRNRHQSGKKTRLGDPKVMRRPVRLQSRSQRADAYKPSSQHADVDIAKKIAKAVKFFE